jgi:uncharacterized membrane protein
MRSPQTARSSWTAYAQGGFLLVGLWASALSAGFFYTYSISVMPGLAVAEPQSAIGAMQGINAVIRTPVFAFAFFGALLLPLAAALLAWLARHRRVAALAFMCAALYGAGVFGVTFAFNVPLNDSLARADPSGGAAAATWAAYEQSWTAWNHVRAVASSVAFAALAGAVVLHFSRGPSTTTASRDREPR